MSELRDRVNLDFNPLRVRYLVREADTFNAKDKRRDRNPQDARCSQPTIGQPGPF